MHLVLFTKNNCMVHGVKCESLVCQIDVGKKWSTIVRLVDGFSDENQR